ncbi:MAG: hypothetical protein LBN97_07665 [Oscillospiraceae bacterium]|jgi:hypothetical protein|nr:hypothetical protein [Oscillospiraceae bacterium]
MLIERNRYFYGKLLTVRDFKLEQTYNELKRRLLNRVAIGSGVLCGLGVTVSDDATFVLESGMAIDYLGREILVSEPLVRKLEMIDGYGTLANCESAYLCLSYDEYGAEPVNAAGSSSDSRENNRIRESYKVSLTAEAPDYVKILQAQGHENVSVLYSTDELTLVLSAPNAVLAGEMLELSVLIVKNQNTSPVHFSLEWECNLIDSGGKRIIADFAESSTDTATVREVKFSYPVERLSETAVMLFPVGIEMNIQLGNWKYKNFIQPEIELHICATPDSLREYKHISENLGKLLITETLPIYLAKLELITVTDRVFLNSAVNLPFGQSFARTATPEVTAVHQKLDITTSVKALEYWQSPDVKATNGDNAVHLEFALPRPESYDYRTSHGYVDIAMPGGIKVNAKYFSDEIAHGLGPGHINIRLAIEFRETDGEDGSAIIFGNSEVFRAKNSEEMPPWAEAAAVVYPSRGTMRIGVWTHDTVDGSSLRVHYFADKPDHDTRPLIEGATVSITILPEISRVFCREQVRFRAEVKGAADKSVLWSVKDTNGGEVDANGTYQAPEVRGTYEIIAKAAADETVTASAFVIVE